MATYTKFNAFVENMAEKVHNLGSDQLKIASTNTAPTASNSVYTDLTSPLGTTNLSGATPFNITTSSSSQTSGTYKLVLADLVLTASGGSFGPFRYVVVYNDTATNDPLIGYYDYGSSITVNDGETFTIDFDGTNGLFTLA
ncbi:MAG TPA: hypothetical protein VF596_16335 [Pyrinomonadaceae bacterium]|jgi:hypothetical protein